MTRVTPIYISTLDVHEIARFHQILDYINESIARLQNDGDERVAEILKNISQAAIRDRNLKDMCYLIMKTIRTLALQADLPPAERRLGVIRGALTYISMLLFANPDIHNYFEAHLDDLRGFFGISE